MKRPLFGCILSLIRQLLIKGPMQTSLTHRIGAVLIFTLLSLVFLPSLLIAALIACSVFSEVFGPVVEQPPSHSKIKALPPDAATLRASLHSFCDSPAETAFLDAMIYAFDLKPVNGVLTGRGLRLQMQVPVERYRLDFLLDRRLVVEIDGAAFHSAPEAIEKDRQRDAALSARGFEILRIPAKISLYAPQDAIARVRQARAVVVQQNQAKTAALRESLRPAALFSALKDAATATRDGIARANHYIDAEAKKAEDRDRIMLAETQRQLLERHQAEVAGNAEREAVFDQVAQRFGVVRKNG